MNRLHRARVDAEKSGEVLDLVDTHFGRAGLHLPETIVERAFRQWRGEPDYNASALGRLGTRRAIADWYGRHKINVEAEGVLLTAGSTLSYHLLFATLPGDRPPALPKPAYPLFEEIATLNRIQPVWYALDPGENWRIDRASVERAIRRGAGCVVLVTPNNPCGTAVDADDLRWVCGVAAAAGIPVVSDEVFATFTNGLVSTPEAPGRAPSALACGSSLGTDVFVVDGLSKSAAAPEVKLGWIATNNAHGTLWRSIEFAHDAYLSTSAFAEHVGSVLLRHGLEHLRSVAVAVAARRRAFLRGAAQIEALKLYPPAAGIHAVFAIERNRAAEAFGSADDEEIAIELVRRERLFLHPGYLYGIDMEDPHFVVSYLGREETTRDGLNRLGAALARRST